MDMYCFEGSNGDIIEKHGDRKVIEIIVIEEILIANGLTVLMMWFLLLCRRQKQRKSP